jgi:hypothetical protein
MRTLPALMLAAALLPSLAWIAPAHAQPSRPAATLSLPQAERNAVELKQGMSAEEVQKLLGKPRRTSLKNHGPVNSQGTLQWTYVWASSTNQGTLQVEFAAKAPEAWYVDSWEWRSY